MAHSTVQVDYDLVANGDHVTIGDATFAGESAYPDAMDWLQQRAAHAGAARVVRSHDAGTGAETVFSIDRAGVIAPVTGPVEDRSRLGLAVGGAAAAGGPVDVARDPSRPRARTGVRR